MSEDRLRQLRKELVSLDERLVSLLNERAKVACMIGAMKRSMGKDIYDPVQEAGVYERLGRLNAGPLTDVSLKWIFREIVSASRALQAPVTVAFLGPETSFSHLALLNHFGRSVTALPQDTIAGVFTAVEKGRASWGIVPLENSTEGPVKLTLDRLISTPLTIRAEIFLRVSHTLSSLEGEREQIRRVYSHPQALAQCQEWLRKHLPRAECIDVRSTAEAAAMAANDREAAAIGTSFAAEYYGLRIVAEGIEDHPLNTTRFLVMGYGVNGPSGRDKTSILFGTPHIPGSLYHALEPFARMGVNLTRIASYPIRDRLWEYVFFVDFLGHGEEEPYKQCLEDVTAKTSFVKCLGSYPVGEEP